MAKQKTNGTLVKVHHEPTPTDLIQLGLQNNVDLDRLDRLMKMQREWEERKARKSFFEAFGKFQSIAPDLVKNKQVKFDHKEGGGKTEYKYQELGDIAKHIRPALAEVGLSYRWDQHEDGAKITVWCIISHIDGHEEKSQPLSGDYDTSGKKNLIQQKASTITYLRRYTLTGMLGLSTMEVDNDGLGGAKPMGQGLPEATAGQVNNLSKRIVLKANKEEMEGVIAEAQKHLKLTDENLKDLNKTIEITLNAKRPKETVSH